MSAAAAPAPVEANSNDVVTLNIGGVFYTTLKSTLAKGGPNFFTALFDPTSLHPLRKDQNGNIYIDRPGTYFAPILEYLMTGDFIIPLNFQGYEKQIAREAQYYLIQIPNQLFSLTQALDWVTDTWIRDQQLTSQISQIESTSEKILKIVRLPRARAFRSAVGSNPRSPPVQVLHHFQQNASSGDKLACDFFFPAINKVMTELEVLQGAWTAKVNRSAFDSLAAELSLYHRRAADQDQEAASWSSRLATFLGDKSKARALVRYCARNALTVGVDPIYIPSRETEEKAAKTPGLPSPVIIGYRVSHQSKE